ncbi:MAG: hypothetical protein ABIA67_01040 [Candidatus Margulisiibacteriota bacterium]
MKKPLGFGLVLMLLFGVIASQAISQTTWIINKNGALYYNLGRVGIGLQNPAARLHVKHPERAFLAEANSDETGKNKDAITGKAFGPGITNRGVFGSAQGGQLNIGVQGQSSGKTGNNYAIYGDNQAYNGFAGYFTGGKAYFEGPVGIGNENPIYKLDVNGAVKATQFVGDGSQLTNIGSQSQGGASLWTQSGPNIYFNAGNVGIKNLNPAYTLDVNGNARILGDIQMNNTSLKQEIAKVARLEQEVANLKADLAQLKATMQQAPRPGTPAPTFPPIFQTTTTTTTYTPPTTSSPFGGPAGPEQQGLPEENLDFKIRRR